MKFLADDGQTLPKMALFYGASFTMPIYIWRYSSLILRDFHIMRRRRQHDISSSCKLMPAKWPFIAIIMIFRRTRFARADMRSLFASENLKIMTRMVPAHNKFQLIIRRGSGTAMVCHVAFQYRALYALRLGAYS